MVQKSRTMYCEICKQGFLSVDDDAMREHKKDAHPLEYEAQFPSAWTRLCRWLRNLFTL